MQRSLNSLELQDLLPLVARLNEEANRPVRLQEQAVRGNLLECLDGVDLAPLRVQEILRNLLHLERHREEWVVDGRRWCGYVEYMHMRMRVHMHIHMHVHVHMHMQPARTYMRMG